MSERFDKEAAYDAEINPLMAQIIDICKREAIPMVASFHLRDAAEDDDGEDDGENCGDMLCTTALTAFENTPYSFKAAYGNFLSRGPEMFALTITKAK